MLGGLLKLKEENKMHQNQIELWQHQHTFNIDKKNIEKD